jgi:hypothetical protein
MTTDTDTLFGGNPKAGEFGTGSGPGRPRQVIRLHPCGEQRSVVPRQTCVANVITPDSPTIIARAESTPATVCG